MDLAALNEFITKNQLFLSLSGAAGVSYVLYGIRALPQRFITFLNRIAFTEMTVRSDSPAFGWVSEWIANHPQLHNARVVQLVGSHENDNDDGFDIYYTNMRKIDLVKTVGEGATFFLWWHGRPTFITRHRLEETMNITDEFRIRILGRSHAPFERLIRETKTAINERNGLRILTQRGDSWTASPQKLLRDIDSVFLPDAIKDTVIADISRFLDGKKRHQKLGTPWRYGVLFSGPPGTGKTSFVKALASHFNLPICTVSLSSCTQDTQLISLFSNLPTPVILLIEDIDAVTVARARNEDSGGDVPQASPPPAPSLKGRKKNGDEEGGRITLSGLLNAIDGVATAEGIVTVMTTNHPDKIDPALLRPGRCDRHVVFENACEEQITKMFRAHFDKEPDREIVKMAAAAKISYARLQFAFISDGENGLKKVLEKDDEKAHIDSEK